MLGSIIGHILGENYGIPEKVEEKSREILDDGTYNLLKDKYFSSKVYRIRTDNRGQYD